jgi:hypothetical protein
MVGLNLLVRYELFEGSDINTSDFMGPKFLKQYAQKVKQKKSACSNWLILEFHFL